MLHIICALKCEATPLIDYYRLEKITDKVTFPCYTDRHGNITLTISHPGKTNAAAATSFTHEYFKCGKNDCWLNIGLAGHQSMEIGQVALAHKIEDSGNGTTWYPQIVFTPPCPTLALKTLDKPSVKYEESMFDMEASGFYSISSRIAFAELAHCLKIISDNCTRPAEKPDKIFFSSLIEQQLRTIDQLVNLILALSAELEQAYEHSQYFETCIKRWHFTRYEQYVLSGLLNRWRVLMPDDDPVANTININNSKEFIALLERKLDSSFIRF